MIQFLRQYLPQEHMARLNTLAWMVTCVLLLGTVNLDHWLPIVVYPDPRPRQSASIRRRFQRFLTNVRHVDPRRLYAPFIQTALSAWAGRTLYLALDTTTLAGRLVIVRVSLIYRGRAVPIAWTVLDQRSTMVSLEQYADLLRYVASLLPPAAHPILLGDRGFRDVDLMALAHHLHWGFRLRLVKSEEVELDNGTICKLGELRLAPGQVRFFQRVWLTQARYGPVNLALGWAAGANTEPWYIATDAKAGWDTLGEYGLRMDIDEGFRDDKSGGFQLEDSRLDAPAAVERLLLVLALCVVHLVALGSAVVDTGLRRCVDPHWRRGLSYLQIGWRYLRQVLAHRWAVRLTCHLDSRPDPEPVLPKRVLTWTEVPADAPIRC
jgi:hypothetical protein